MPVPYTDVSKEKDQQELRSDTDGGKLHQKQEKKSFFKQHAISMDMTDSMKAA